jgi:hypothetical protein
LFLFKVPEVVTTEPPPEKKSMDIVVYSVIALLVLGLGAMSFMGKKPTGLKLYTLVSSVIFSPPG